MTNRSEPTTAAGRAMLAFSESDARPLPEYGYDSILAIILAIEAEAAQPASASGLRELLARAVSGTGGPYTHEFVPGASRAASLTTEWTCQQCGYSELVSASPSDPPDDSRLFEHGLNHGRMQARSDLPALDVDSGTTTDCPLVGVHEHAFRGPHRFHEWDPAEYARYLAAIQEQQP